MMDIGSAKLLAHAGFEALASTSAGFSWSQGLPDGKAPLEGKGPPRLLDAVPLSAAPPVSGTEPPITIFFSWAKAGRRAGAASAAALTPVAST